MLAAVGATLKRSKKHLVFGLPNGKTVTIASSPSDGRFGEKNAIGDWTRTVLTFTRRRRSSSSSASSSNGSARRRALGITSDGYPRVRDIQEAPSVGAGLRSRS
jgi:hypothetical protein